MMDVQRHKKILSDRKSPPEMTMTFKKSTTNNKKQSLTDKEIVQIAKFKSKPPARQQGRNWNRVDVDMTIDETTLSNNSDENKEHHKPMQNIPNDKKIQ